MSGSVALINGKVLSMDAAGRRYSALVVEDGRITRLGEAAELKQYAAERNVRILDGGGRTVVPGAIDTHFHLTLTGMSLTSVDFNVCRSFKMDLSRRSCIALVISTGK